MHGLTPATMERDPDTRDTEPYSQGPDYTQPTQCTQGLMDPRRMGRNNSGLSEADISDVMCILHPCSPAAFKIVATTAERTPQNVLQNHGYEDYDDDLTQSVLEEQETFILNSDGPNQAMDLALRFTGNMINATLGFVFGRNARICDIVLATDTYKRVSNMHFSIFMNESGVLMLRDMSTNGTMVDDVVLKGKSAQEPQTRMLNGGSIVQILSPKSEEIVKFIVRIPSREGHVEEYESKFQLYMRRVAIAEATMVKENDMAKRLAVTQARTQSASSYKAPLMPNQFGMQWGGGDKYNVIGMIGKGAFATVFQLATKSEGHLYAAKELEKRRFMKNGVLDRKLDNELQIMKATGHPNIVRYVDYHDHANHLYIIMEFVPCGDLQQYLSNHGALTEDLGKKLAKQMLDSLCYLHANKITHRDIKPDNILLANLDPDHFTIKLSDFGLSKLVRDNDTFLKTFCGTLLYCAPEVFPHYDAHVASGRGQKRPRKSNAQPSKFHSYSASVDIWSFGAVLWYSLCIKPPFEGVADNTGRGMFEKIMMTPLDPADLVRQGVSDNAVALLAEMLNTDPASRPSPAQCLRHRWFGQAHAATAGGAASPELGLRAIAEEEEAEGGAEPDMSQLSIHEQSFGSGDSQDYDEASIHSGSMDFFDPRQSKRFKSEAFAYREHSEMVDSSPELLQRSIRIMHQPDHVTPQKPNSGQPKLFGEISQSALSSNPHGLQTPAITQFQEIKGSPGGSQHPDFSQPLQQAHLTAARGAVASPSLFGAESLLRDVRMDSPESTDSPAAEPDEPTTPHTPGDSHAHAEGYSNGTPQVHDDVTPRQEQHSVFSRQINIQIPPSFFFDPDDESTHTAEYASKISGHDFGNDPSFLNKDTSLPATMSGFATDNDHEDEHDDTDVEHEPDVPVLQPPPAGFLKPPPRLGRLVSTPDSFARITINLSKRSTSWGRDKANDNMYPDKYDTRVPKIGIIVYYHGKGLDKMPEGSDFTKLPDLHCGVTTESSLGLLVNGVRLKKAPEGMRNFGTVYTGDEITVYREGGKPGLKFVCEFYHGEGKGKRPESGPRFRVESERKDPSSEKAKGKENVIMTGKVAAA